MGLEFSKSRSEFGINISNVPYVPMFSQNGQLLIFCPKFGEIAQLRAIFGSNIVEGVAEGWVEAEMSWVEVDGVGWKWMELGEGGCVVF